jgi:hypothetical protein
MPDLAGNVKARDAPSPSRKRKFEKREKKLEIGDFY